MISKLIHVVQGSDMHLMEVYRFNLKQKELISFIDYRYIPRLLKLVKWLKYSLVHSPPPLVSTRRIREFSGKRWARMDFLFNI